MRVIICGAVSWTDEKIIRDELAKLPRESTVIHGDCSGVDEIAGRLAADEFGFQVELFVKSQEDYKKYRRGAWKALNERMLESGADLVIGFHPDYKKSQGTKHMIRLARDANVAVQVFGNELTTN